MLFIKKMNSSSKWRVLFYMKVVHARTAFIFLSIRFIFLYYSVFSEDIVYHSLYTCSLMSDSFMKEFGLWLIVSYHPIRCCFSLYLH